MMDPRTAGLKGGREQAANCMKYLPTLCTAILFLQHREVR